MLTYKTKTLQVRVTEEEVARLEKIVRWLNHNDWETERKRREAFKALPSYGPITISDVIRYLIKSDQVDVLHKRAAGKRTTSTR